MGKTTYVGIDYGRGLANIDSATGIRFGVIGQHSLTPEALDDFEADFGEATCGKCGNAAVEFDEEKHGGYEEEAGCSDYACESCERVFDSSDAYSDEALGSYLDEDGYQAHYSDCGDVWVTKSLYYTHAQFCSPCCPGAGNLDSPCEDGPRTYCFGHDFFEEKQAPYPIFEVATGLPVLKEED